MDPSVASELVEALAAELRNREKRRAAAERGLLCEKHPSAAPLI
jgi:hypothetical protein